MQIKLIKNKRADTPTITQLIELVIVVACVIVLIMLLRSLISPSFNKNKETAKSYFDVLQEQIQEADKGKQGEFLIYGNDEVWLAYFSSQERFTWEGNWFFAENKYNNYICMCYKEKDNIACEYCLNLKTSAVLKKGEEYGVWSVKKDEKMYITKENNQYIFSIQK